MKLSFKDITHPEYIEADTENIKRLTNGDIPVYRTEKRYIAKNGSIIWGKLDLNILRDSEGQFLYYLALIEDITGRKSAEEKIKLNLKEKEALLQELYHRTKNNMQVISAMLDLQSSRYKNDIIKSIFKDMENRIRSMALVHEKLYQSRNLSSINLGDYIKELSELILKSFEVVPGKITPRFELEDIFVLMDTAVPCGLIINELLSNCFKHAFPGERTGEIKIRLQRTCDEIELEISDNGIGTSENFNFRTDGNLGIQSIIAISEQQLQGKIEFSGKTGSSCKINFKDSLYKSRV